MSDEFPGFCPAIFAPESRGDPLAAFPTLARDGRPYNLWLTERWLEPVLARWSAPREAGGNPAALVRSDFAWASGGVRGAFRELVPMAAAVGEPAILAGMSVTANLQRTLAILGEHLLRGGRLLPAPSPAAGPPFRLSRLWCGLTEYPERSPYFPARVRAPLHPSRLRLGRRDPRHLANAFWCSLDAINNRCDEAIAALRKEILRHGLYTPAAAGPAPVRRTGPAASG
jgi:hypothetical protein